VEGSAPSEKKEEPANKVEAGNIALTTLGTFVPTNQKSRMMGIHLDRLEPYERATWDKQLLREQQEQMESNHHENQATGKERLD
jgi:hypothetical protein